MNSHAVLIFLLAGFAATTAQMHSTESVLIYGTTVELKCPEGDEEITWQEKDKSPTEGQDATYIINGYTDEKDGLYTCESKILNKRYKFYIKAVVCENCYELDMTLAIGVIIGDVLVTLGVVLIVYLCARQKSDTIPPQRATRQQARGPPVPNPDYQELNPATRSNDIYSHAHR